MAAREGGLVTRPSVRRDYVGDLVAAIERAGLPLPVREYRFHPVRRWRFDLAWPDRAMAVEVDGGVWIGGRHNTGSGMTKDHEKMAEAMCLGWLVLRVTTAQVRSGEALGWLTRLLSSPGSAAAASRFSGPDPARAATSGSTRRLPRSTRTRATMRVGTRTGSGA